jgi:hypothetical protein
MLDQVMDGEDMLELGLCVYADVAGFALWMTRNELSKRVTL